MPPRVWISDVTFSDDRTLQLGPKDVLVIVGPNNAGKSAALRALRDKVANPAQDSPVVKSLTIAREGTSADVEAWLHSFAQQQNPSGGNPAYFAYGAGVHRSALGQWNIPAHSLGSLTRFFVHLLSAEERLTGANPAASIAVTREPSVHPIHFLYRDDALDARLSAAFRKAFGADLVVHRGAGSQVPLHVGDKPTPKGDQDRISLPYIQKLEKLPALHQQGDGMRSFASVLLHTSVGREAYFSLMNPRHSSIHHRLVCLGARWQHQHRLKGSYS